MTQGDKKKKSNGSGHGASVKTDPEKATAEAKSAPGSTAKVAHAEGAHGGGAKGHGGHGDHSAKIRQYFIIFAVLFVLTVLEVVVAQVPGIGKGALAIALVGLALTKAAFVGLYYMHLNQETRILRLTVALPMVFPALYAVVLIGEAAWRLTR